MIDASTNEVELNVGNIMFECEICRQNTPKKECFILDYKPKKDDGTQHDATYLAFCYTCFQFFLANGGVEELNKSH